MAPRATGVVLLILMAGCVFDSEGSTSLSFASNVPKDYEGQGNVDCQQETVLSIAMMGLRTGSMRVQVFDGDGATAFDQTYLGGEGGEDERSLFGAPGQWTLQMQGSLGEGKASVTLSC